MRFVVGHWCLEPIDDEARKSIRDSKGEAVEVELLHDRDMIEHRRIMATINEVAKALRVPPEKVRAELLVATGNFQLLGDLLGTPVVAINSMSRHNMKDHELHAFWEEAKEVIKMKLLARIQDSAERERLTETLSLQSA